MPDDDTTTDPTEGDHELTPAELDDKYPTADPERLAEADRAAEATADATGGAEDADVTPDGSVGTPDPTAADTAVQAPPPAPESDPGPQG